MWKTFLNFNNIYLVFFKGFGFSFSGCYWDDWRLENSFYGEIDNSNEISYGWDEKNFVNIFQKVENLNVVDESSYLSIFKINPKFERIHEWY
jgi:hypothetical protein